MHAELNPASQRQYSADELRGAYVDAQETATLRTIDPGEPDGPESSRRPRRRHGPDPGSAPSPSAGFESVLALPFADGGIAWDPHLVFPGLRAGRAAEQQHQPRARGPRSAPATEPRSPRARRRRAPRRWAAPRSTSPARSASPSPPSSTSSRGRASRPGTPVGISGLEQAFNPHLAGKPGGQLIADSGRRRRRACSPRASRRRASR